MNEEFALYPKQREVVEAVIDAPITGVEEIFLIGPIGSTKTFAMAFTHINIAYFFPGSIIPVGRKDLSEAQIGTFLVYLEVLEKVGLREGKHYTLRQAPNDLRIKFTTGSIIQFIGMNKSRDREWNKLKITATMAGVDEVDDVDEGGYDTLFSRTGRRNENGAPRVMLSACNPNDAWTKRRIYLPWLKKIGRLPDTMEQKEIDAIEDLPDSKLVIEFTMEDSPLYPTGYYDRFLLRPRAWVERFLKNNWNYFDDSKSLFKQRALDLLTVDDIDSGDKYIGVDPNAGGSDRACIFLMENNAFVDCEVYTTEDLERLALEDEKEPLNPGAILGRLTAEMAERERVGADHIGGDVVGIGQGWLTYMLSHGYKRVRQFHAGGKPHQTPEEERKKIKPPYDMLRSQVFSMWAMDTENRNVFFYSAMPHLSSLKKELLLHEGDSTAKVFKLMPKDELKKMLGSSPDIADAGAIAYWVRMLCLEKPTVKGAHASVGRGIDDLAKGW